MSEPIFFKGPKTVLLADIAAATGAPPTVKIDPSIVIRGAAPISTAEPGDITVLAAPEDALLLQESGASACFTAPNFAHLVPASMPALVIEEPLRAYALALDMIFPRSLQAASLLGASGINPGASIHAEARLEQGVIVDPGAVIGPRAEIGSGSIIGGNSVIGFEVRIGRDCVIGPHATISHALIGNGVIVQPGARIGQAGIDPFFTASAADPVNGLKLPKVGRVIIQDRVEIGANAAIARGSGGDTVIGEATRIGSLAQIPENAAIGRYCFIPARASLAAGERLGDFAMIAVRR